MNQKVFISHGDIIIDKIYNDNLELINQDGGGCNWNDLYNLSLMGEKCYAFGSCGNDEEAKIAINSLKKVGVNTDNIIVENKSTNAMNIIIPNKNLDDNSIIHSWYNPITLDFTMHFSKKLRTNLSLKYTKSLLHLMDKFTIELWAKFQDITNSNIFSIETLNFNIFNGLFKLSYHEQEIPYEIIQQYNLPLDTYAHITFLYKKILRKF